jgi:hypothetical protein
MDLFRTFALRQRFDDEAVDVLGLREYLGEKLPERW